MDNEGLAQAMEFVVGLNDDVHARSEVEIEGRTYSRGTLTPVMEPSVPRVDLHTLSGVVDYCNANVDGLDLATCLIHVADPVKVFLLTNAFGKFKQRAKVIESTPILPSFQFGRFMSSEDFIIGLNAMFVPGGDRDLLLQDVAKIKVEVGSGVEDDGTSQTVSVQAGARLMSKQLLKPRVTLHPYCTFQEVEQPEREFIFRLSGDGQPGLFVADGECWRNRAMDSIKAYLGTQLPNMNIIA